MKRAALLIGPSASIVCLAIAYAITGWPVFRIALLLDTWLCVAGATWLLTRRFS